MSKAQELSQLDIGVNVQSYDSNLTSFVSTFTLPTVDGTANQVLRDIPLQEEFPENVTWPEQPGA